MIAIAILPGCRRVSDAPALDPVQAAIAATPADHVGRYAFNDKVVLANRTPFNFSKCTLVFDERISAELETLPAGGDAVVMRTKFHPYTEGAEFFEIGERAGRMRCLTADGPRTVTFAAMTGAPVTVVIPPK